MELLKHANSNWKRLDKILSGIVDALNFRTPRKGNGILLTESPSGVMISIDPKTLERAQQPGTGAGGGGGGTPTGGPTEGAWVTIMIMDDNCHKFALNVWAQNPPRAA